MRQGSGPLAMRTSVLCGLMRTALALVEKWCAGAGMSVNPSKSVLVNFTSRYKVKPLSGLSLRKGKWYIWAYLSTPS